jgi:hypothetical protein
VSSLHARGSAFDMTPEQAEAIVRSLAPVAKAVRDFGDALARSVSDVSALAERLMAIPEVRARVTYDRRMEAHWHRTAGRPRSRRRRGRR